MLLSSHAVAGKMEKGFYSLSNCRYLKSGLDVHHLDMRYRDVMLSVFKMLKYGRLPVKCLVSFIPCSVY